MPWRNVLNRNGAAQDGDFARSFDFDVTTADGAFMLNHAFVAQGHLMAFVLLFEVMLASALAGIALVGIPLEMSRHRRFQARMRQADRIYRRAEKNLHKTAVVLREAMEHGDGVSARLRLHVEALSSALSALGLHREDCDARKDESFDNQPSHQECSCEMRALFTTDPIELERIATTEGDEEMHVHE